MDTLKLGNKEYEIKFTTFALSKLKDLDMNELTNIEENGKVFYIAEVLVDLTYAIVTTQGNNSSKSLISQLLDESFENGDNNPTELLQKMIEALTDSPFFKAMGSKETPKKAPQKKSQK